MSAEQSAYYDRIGKLPPKVQEIEEFSRHSRAARDAQYAYFDACGYGPVGRILDGWFNPKWNGLGNINDWATIGWGFTATPIVAEAPPTALNQVTEYVGRQPASMVRLELEFGAEAEAGLQRSYASNPGFGMAAMARPRLPNPVNWMAKGGRVTHHSDGSTTYVDWMGNKVVYSSAGHPDFSPYVHPVNGTVSIKQTGDNRVDFPAANAERRLPQPAGWVWHHHQNGTTMQLVPWEINNRFSHTGGASYSR